MAALFSHLMAFALGGLFALAVIALAERRGSRRRPSVKRGYRGRRTR